MLCARMAFIYTFHSLRLVDLGEFFFVTSTSNHISSHQWIIYYNTDNIWRRNIYYKLIEIKNKFVNCEPRGTPVALCNQYSIISSTFNFTLNIIPAFTQRREEISVILDVLVVFQVPSLFGSFLKPELGCMLEFVRCRCRVLPRRSTVVRFLVL